MTDVLFEEVQRALLLQVRSNIAQALVDVAAEMASKDASFFGTLGQPVPDTPLPVPVTWETGNHPYILHRPLEEFPTVVANCHEHPEVRGPLDQVELVAHRAYVEAFIATIVDEGTADRMVKRYLKAVNRCVLKDLTLGGLCLPVETVPQASTSNVSAARVADDDDVVVFHAGCLVSYVFQVPQIW